MEILSKVISIFRAFCKTYADNATLVSNSLVAHIFVLQQVDQKAATLNYLLSLLNIIFLTCLMGAVTNLKVSNFLEIPPDL